MYFCVNFYVFCVRHWSSKEIIHFFDNLFFLALYSYSIKHIQKSSKIEKAMKKREEGKSKEKEEKHKKWKGKEWRKIHKGKEKRVWSK